MKRAGLEVIFDDREISPGVKFAEADLRGMPLRVTISDRSLDKGGVELKRRTNKEIKLVPLDQAVTATAAEVKALQDEMDPALERVPVWKSQNERIQ
jgi:prolyl-tRNA synthetase